MRIHVSNASDDPIYEQIARQIKDQIVEWLDPKPITYRQVDPLSVDFRGYLPNQK